MSDPAPSRTGDQIGRKADRSDPPFCCCREHTPIARAEINQHVLRAELVKCKELIEITFVGWHERRPTKHDEQKTGAEQR